MAQDGAHDRSGGGKSEGASRLEMISASIGLAIVAALLGFLSWHALTANADAPPQVEVAAGTITRAGGTWVVEFVVRNASANTAQDLQVEGTLKQGGTVVETSQATLAFAPGRSLRRGGLIFTHDPADHTLELRATGYQEP